MPIVVHVPVEFPDKTPPSGLHRVSKAVHEYGKKLAAADSSFRKETKTPKTQKSGSALGAGDDEAQAVAGRLAKMLESAEPADEAAKGKIFQGIIRYRKIARQLPEETRATIDRKIAAYSNARVPKKKM
jgi:hypothetical protein